MSNGAHGNERVEAFGRRLQALIDERGVTKRWLAQRCGMSYNTVTYMTHGRRFPTLWSLDRLREALGCTWEELMSDDAGPCRVRLAHPDMGGFHEYVCGTHRVQFKYRGDMNFCPVCGRRASLGTWR